MNLCIYTGAADKSQAAVTSTTDLTVVQSLEQLVLGDQPTINVTFTDGSAAPSWAGQAGYTMTVGLGLLDVNGLAGQTDVTSTTQITGGWSVVLDLTTQAIIDAMALQVGSAVDWTRFPFTTRMPGPRPNGGWFTLQVAVKNNLTGYWTTYATLRMYLRNRVLNVQAVPVSPIPPPFVTVPSSMTDSGTPGQMAIGGGYLYICTATNTWRRSPLTQFT